MKQLLKIALCALLNISAQQFIHAMEYKVDVRDPVKSSPHEAPPGEFGGKSMGEIASIRSTASIPTEAQISRGNAKFTNDIAAKNPTTGKEYTLNELQAKYETNITNLTNPAEIQTNRQALDRVNSELKNQRQETQSTAQSIATEGFDLSFNSKPLVEPSVAKESTSLIESNAQNKSDTQVTDVLPVKPTASFDLFAENKNNNVDNSIEMTNQLTKKFKLQAENVHSEEQATLVNNAVALEVGGENLPPEKQAELQLKQSEQRWFNPYDGSKFQEMIESSLNFVQSKGYKTNAQITAEGQIYEKAEAIKTARDKNPELTAQDKKNNINQSINNPIDTTNLYTVFNMEKPKTITTENSIALRKELIKNKNELLKIHSPKNNPAYTEGENKTYNLPEKNTKIIQDAFDKLYSQIKMTGMLNKQGVSINK